MPTTRDIARLVITDTDRLAALRRRTRAAETRSRGGRVDASRSVDPRVWRAAMARAGGDPSRIEIVSPTEVVVR